MLRVACRSRTRYLARINLLRKYYSTTQGEFLVEARSRAFWDSPENRAKYKEWLSQKLSLETDKDWYNVTTRDLVDNQGAQLIVKHQTLTGAISALRPDHEWLPWHFSEASIIKTRDLRVKSDVTEEQRQYMEDLGTRLGYTQLEDWYNVSRSDFESRFGNQLLSKHENSTSRAITATFRHHQWSQWLFQNDPIPQTFWDGDLEKCRAYMMWLGQQLGFKAPTDWYRLTVEDLQNHSGGPLLKLFDDSVRKAVASVFSEHEWLPWLFSQVLTSFWDKKDNQRSYLEWLGRKLNFTKPEDWYDLSHNNVMDNFGSRLYQQFNGLTDIAQFMFPEHKFLPWMWPGHRHNSISEFFNEHKNRQTYMEWLAKQLGYTKPEHWYRVSVKDFEKNYGAHFLSRYGNSPTKAVMDVIEHDWLPWHFATLHKGYWNNPSNCTKYMLWLGERLKFTKPEDWLNLSQELLNVNYGQNLLQLHRNSPSKLVLEYLPHLKLHRLEFQAKTNERNPRSCKEYVDLVGPQLGIKKLDDWYLVSTARLMRAPAYRVIKQNGNIGAVLKAAYPDHAWDLATFERKNLFNQPLLLGYIKNMFSDKDLVIHNSYRHPDLVHQGSGRSIELDIYIPRYDFAIEFNGEQHYNNVLFTSQSLEKRLALDAEKAELCKKNNITLLVVPFWWSKNEEDLRATISKYRPDLTSRMKDQNGGGIAITQPVDPSLAPVTVDIKVDQVVRSKQFMLAVTADLSEPPKHNWFGWLMSEKLDGVRGLWDGNHLISRGGNIINMPEERRSKMPDIALDGELWLNREKGVSEVQQIAVWKNDDDLGLRWRDVKFCVFDAPHHPGSLIERILYLQKMKGALPAFAELIEHHICQSPKHVSSFVEEVLHRNGEGVILRDPTSIYVAGRSNTYLRLKLELHDEVKVTERITKPVAERFVNCEQPNGRTVLVRFPYSRAPDVGAIVTVSHLGVMKSGLFRAPRFHSMRYDRSWDDIVVSFKELTKPGYANANVK